MWFVRLSWIIGISSFIFLIVYSFYNWSFYYLIITLIYGYVISFLGNSICYHRYLSHRSFNTGHKRKLFLLATNLLTGQGSVIYSVSMHRHHHKHSDTEKDVHSSKHSAIDSFFFSLNNFSYFENKNIRPPIDLLKDQTVLFFHKNYLLIWMSILILTSLIDWRISLICLSVVGMTTIHTNFVRTFLSHTSNRFSYRNFDTNDLSQNTKFQFFSLSEGLHNNHHMHPNLYNQAILSNEFDPAAWVIKNFFEKDNNK
jgi:fatty-acid desaturase